MIVLTSYCKVLASLLYLTRAFVLMGRRPVRRSQAHTVRSTPVARERLIGERIQPKRPWSSTILIWTEKLVASRRRRGSGEGALDDGRRLGRMGRSGGRGLLLHRSERLKESENDRQREEVNLEKSTKKSSESN